MSQPGGRLWLGPLLLVLLVVLIYLLSILPHSYSFKNDEVPFEPRVDGAGIGSETAETSDPRCNHRGFFNETSGICECRLSKGTHCEKRICLHEGWLTDSGKCRCANNFVGENCEFACNGHVNETTGVCICFTRFVGPGCNEFCMHGEVIDRTCRCNEGYTGSNCNTCTLPSCSSYKRGSMNSRLTFSGLSFCLITIGLLCVSASRRRVPPAEDTWYRVFNPVPTRRAEFLCGGTWVPRDRSVLVTSRARAVTVAVTPPPSYSAVTDSQGPPTYEEAMAVMQPDEDNKEEGTEQNENEQ